MVEDSGKKDPKTALLALREWEVHSIVNLGERFGELLSEEDIPLSFALLNMSAGLVHKEWVLAERDGQSGSESWFFVIPSQMEDFSSKLPQSTPQNLEGLALKLGIEPKVVFKAAIRTKALTENFREPICISLDGGPEGLRLTEVLLPSSTKDGIVRQARKEYSLEYYSYFEEKEGEPIRTLLVHINPDKVNFQTLFPAVLVFSTHVANKRQRSQVRVESA